RPKLLMIDELSLGLAPTVVEQLLQAIRRIHAQGTAIILVEQSVNVALTVAERAYFLEKGQVRFHGATTDLLDRSDILRAVFFEGAASGTSAKQASGVARPQRRLAKPDRREEKPAVLEVSRLSRAFGGIRAVDDVSFALHDGEIL